MAKWYKIAVAKATGAIDINIFDQIGDWGYTAMDFARDLEAAGKGAVNVRINTPGGDVFQGFAIYNILNRIRDRVTVTIEGLAASMGSVIAMAGKKVIMPENAMMMIHDPSGAAVGGPEEMASFADALGKMRDGIVKAYKDRTGLAEDKIRQMMANETWLSASEAVKLGFADEIEKPIAMAAHAGFDLKCYQNVPKFGTPTQEGVEGMKRDAIKALVALAGLKSVALGDTIPEGKTVEEVVAAIQAEKTKEETAAQTTAAAAAAAARAAEGKAPTAEDIRTEIFAEMTEVRSLCKLAGFPDKADEFISAKKSAKEVIAALEQLKKDAVDAGKTGRGKRAAASTADEVSARHNARQQGESNAMELDTTAVWDKFNAVGKRKSA